MSKTDKVRLLIHSALLLEGSYINSHDNVILILRELGLLFNCNINLMTLYSRAYPQEELHNIVKQTLKEDLKFDIGEYKEF